MSDQQQQQQQEQQAPGEQQQETVTITVASNTAGQQQEAPVNSRFMSAINRAKTGMLERPIRYDVISIIFTLLILIGGIIGYVAKESLPSLIAGLVFGVLLGLSTYLEGARKNPYPLIVTLIILGAMFAYRYFQSYKFMPSGLFAILTLIMIARHCYLLYLRRQRAAEEPSP